MAIAHVRKGDTVVVVAGKERGKRGRVLRVIPDKNRVVVEQRRTVPGGRTGVIPSGRRAGRDGP